MSDAHLHSELLTQIGLLAKMGREKRYRDVHADLKFCIAMDRHRDKTVRHKAESADFKQRGETA